MKIALIGYGKMGKAIEGIAVRKGHDVVLIINQGNLSELTSGNLKKADVAIEFTGPSTAKANLLRCAEAGVPVVCGSTGWTSGLDEVKKIFAAEHTGLVYASNFSIGVNLFFEVNRKLAALMAPHSEYSASLTETHHTQKKDAPSGTAITLAEQILAEIPRLTSWVNRPVQADGELPIISERTDPAPGTHEIRYSSAIDDIQIIHTAHNREGFAGGAVLAAEFLKGKQGLYSMKDVLGL